MRLLVLLLFAAGCDRAQKPPEPPAPMPPSPVVRPADADMSQAIAVDRTDAAAPAPAPASVNNPLCSGLKPDGLMRNAIHAEVGDELELEFLVEDGGMDGATLRPFFEQSTLTLSAGAISVELSPQTTDLSLTAVSALDDETRTALATSEPAEVVVEYSGACEDSEVCDTSSVSWKCELPTRLVVPDPESPPTRQPRAEVEGKMKAEGLTVARTDKLGKATLKWWALPDEHEFLEVAAEMDEGRCTYTTGSEAFAARCPSTPSAVGKNWVVFGHCSPQFVARTKVAAYLTGERAADWAADARRFPYQWNGEVCRVQGFTSRDVLEITSACCGDHHEIKLNPATRTREAEWVQREQ